MTTDNELEAHPYKNCSTSPKSVLTGTVTFDKDELYNIIDFIEIEFIRAIRDDEDIDNIDYLVSMMNALQKLRFAYESIRQQEESK